MTEIVADSVEVYRAFGKYNQHVDNEHYQYIVDLGKRLMAEMVLQ